jgi:hypothetical protein
MAAFDHILTAALKIMPTPTHGCIYIAALDIIPMAALN